MNRIQNGDFSSGFDYWTNGTGGTAYALDSRQAKASSHPEAETELTYGMMQSLGSNDEIVSAKISVWAKWEAIWGDLQTGRNRFIVKLQKPDFSLVTLVDTTKEAVSGNANILDEYDATSDMDQYGTYRLYLYVKTRSVHNTPDPETEEYTQSYGWYDNINLDISVKKYKTVHEKIGSSGAILSEAKVTKSEIVGLSEAYSTEVFSPTFNYETASESMGLNESYSTILKRIHGVVEVVGLSESIQAKRTQGNLETTYILEDLTQWTEISCVETPWIKEKIEIRGG